MSKLMETQKAILISTQNQELGTLIEQKGAYLRQLAYLVINGSLGLENASKLLINY